MRDTHRNLSTENKLGGIVLGTERSHFVGMRQVLRTLSWLRSSWVAANVIAAWKGYALCLSALERSGSIMGAFLRSHMASS